jgi:UDP-GlcNAc3NAcA epimerase
MKRIVTIIGARPQFIKAAPVSRVLRREHQEYLLHTGQHYDSNMSRLFFDELAMPLPDENLEIGSASHGQQTALMMIGIEKTLQRIKPDLVMVYGDTNSTLAGAVAASKLCIPLAHVEAGLRSFNRRMPEEINRLLTDKAADLLFCPTVTAAQHLKNEGIEKGVHIPGDVMYDAALYFADLAQRKASLVKSLSLEEKSYLLITCHRPQNTDRKETLENIIDALIKCGRKTVFPVHPRTRRFLEAFDLLAKVERAANVMLIEPVGYLEMIQLERGAAKILTDSGGVQKEAYFYRVPCITLRDETEWVETVQDGWNVLVGSDKEKIVKAIRSFSPEHAQSNHYGDGHASEKIVGVLKW